MPSARRFPPPWTTEETDVCFIVRDANGRKLANASPPMEGRQPIEVPAACIVRHHAGQALPSKIGHRIGFQWQARKRYLCWTSNPKKTGCASRTMRPSARFADLHLAESHGYSPAPNAGPIRRPRSARSIMTAKLNDIAATDKCRIGRLKQRVKAHCAGEIVRRSPTRWLGADTFDFHCSIPLCPPASAGDPAVVDKAGEPVPALEHVVDRLDDRGRARHSGSFITQPRFQSGQKRSALFLAHAQTFFGAQAVDVALDIEQHVNALDRFQRNRRDRRSGLSAPGIGRDVSQFKELPPSWAQHSAAMIAPEVATDRKARCTRCSVGLQDAGEVPKMPRGMLMPSIARGVIQRVFLDAAAKLQLGRSLS